MTVGEAGDINVTDQHHYLMKLDKIQKTQKIANQ